MKENSYTPRLLDIVILSPDDEDVGKLKGIFIITECITSNLRQIMVQDVVEGRKEA